MHKTLMRFAIAAAVALSLAGCAALDPGGVSILKGGSSFTAPIQQPITRKMYRNVSNSLILVAVGLNIYKSKCEAGSIDASCEAAIAKIQGYTQQAKPVLKNLRIFVRQNDQVNARVAYNTITGLLADIRTTAAANGVQ